MHLGRIDSSSMLHNLVSAQWSPVLLLKFQMTLKLKILMPSGSKKVTQLYFLFSLKSPGKRTLSKFPIRALYGERYLFTGPFSYLKIHAKNSLFFFSKALRKSNPPYSPKAPLYVPQMQGQYGSRHPFPEP
jgi:hypothetical protein